MLISRSSGIEAKAFPKVSYSLGKRYIVVLGHMKEKASSFELETLAATAAMKLAKRRLGLLRCASL